MQTTQRWHQNVHTHINNSCFTSTKAISSDCFTELEYVTGKCRPIYLPWVFIVVMTTALYSLESSLSSIRTLSVPLGEQVTWTGYNLTSHRPSGLSHYHTWASQNVCPCSQFKHTPSSGKVLLPHPELLKPGMRVPLISCSTVLSKPNGMF